MFAGQFRPFGMIAIIDVTFQKEQLTESQLEILLNSFFEVLSFDGICSKSGFISYFLCILLGKDLRNCECVDTLKNNIIRFNKMLKYIKSTVSSSYYQREGEMNIFMHKVKT